MRKTYRSTSGATPRPDVYRKVTDQILAELEAGRVPWVQPWDNSHAGIGLPFNAASQRRYSGVNILTLWHAVTSRGFTGHGFLTFRQATALGGTVRRGERGTPIVYTRRIAPDDRRERSDDREASSDKGFSFLKFFTVFSVDQCEGLPDAIQASPEPVPDGFILPTAQALIDATGADFRISGPEAYYSPTHDFVAVPRPEAFHEPINWYRTAFHELAHWAGHSSRLNRDQSGAFGSVTYGREELVAEMAGAFVCAALGIAPTVRHADYIGSWLAILREDHRAILRAASAASKAADYLLAFQRDLPLTSATADAPVCPLDSSSVAIRRAAA
ncbi:zincin-like metallopeptidase domain-containing protein [Blastomonas sp.]|uniref:ArdC family protein n=1 Tax=Blastomonas sp. TaxID=1909299 RepID=UPI002616406B|nr:zincin-like metallopeptidase domain-containing protein [Blastomonas sp.]MDM7957051.1 zincin-like metallopeptidase domain-containing protein [Blastomonas sp.]